MKKRLGTTGELFPQSVFIIATYDEEGTPNAMNAAWAGECGRIGRRLGQDACQDGRRLPLAPLVAAVGGVLPLAGAAIASRFGKRQ